MGKFIKQSGAADGPQIQLTGDWVLDNLARIQKELRRISAEDAKAQIGHLDTAGAQILLQFKNLSGLKPEQESLLKLVSDAQQKLPKKPEKKNVIVQNLIEIGKSTCAAKKNTADLLSFLGETTINLFGTIIHPSRLRIKSVLRHMHETGVMAVPIVSLIAFLISIVLAYQGADQLKRFGAQIFAINMVGISVLREMGVLLTAIMVAGRSGSAFTAEIGVMKVNEEVDAMRIMGIKPFDFLVLPRLIALMITLPLLAFVADAMGLLGGGIVSFVQLHIAPEQYLDRVRGAVSMSDFWVGIIKAPVFAFFIAMVGCMRGLQVTGSAESVGKLTTVSVVQSIFLVLLLDAVFSIVFTKLGI